MIQEILIIDDTMNLFEEIYGMFNDGNRFEFKIVKSSTVENELKTIPEIILINEDGIERNCIELCEIIRDDEDLNITPVIVISSNTDLEHKFAILKNSIEYYIERPINSQQMYYTIDNVLKLIYNTRKVSPLTGLPGNVQIQTEIKNKLVSNLNFALLYFDLDNFKAYNDVYGFSNGDEIIKFTSKTILKHVHNIESKDNFVGHIGGDDFVAIITTYDYEKICQNIIAEFDVTVPEFYKPEDVERGFVEVANRKGIIEQFPLTSISIAVVEVDHKHFKSTLEIGEIGAQVKHQAKTYMGSTYVINRRKF